MRAAGVLLSLLLCLTSRADAQVSVDMRALDSLGPAPSVARPAPIPSRPARAAITAAPAAGKPAAQAIAPQAPAAAPVAPSPPSVAAAQTPALPTNLPSPPPASSTVAAPVASAEPLPPPVRLVFGTGVTELSPQDEAAIRELAKSMPAPEIESVNVVAYAAGKADDPSTARRLSLSRGMAVRSVLLASGVPSAQIYVRALGSAATDGPADQVDLIVTRIGTVTR